MQNRPLITKKRIIIVGIAILVLMVIVGVFQGGQSVLETPRVQNDNVVMEYPRGYEAEVTPRLITITKEGSDNKIELSSFATLPLGTTKDRVKNVIRAEDDSVEELKINNYDVLKVRSSSSSDESATETATYYYVLGVSVWRMVVSGESEFVAQSPTFAAGVSFVTGRDD